MVIYIYESFLKLDDKLKSEISNTSLLNDVPKTSSGVLELHVEDFKIRYVKTPTTHTSQLKIASIKGSILEQTIKSIITPKGQYFQSKLKNPPGTRNKKEAQQVMVISGPESSDNDM